MRVQLLGPVRVDGQVDALTRRDRIALTVLALRDNAPVTVDTIADALWGDDQPASRVKVVQGCISRLRRRLGADAIVTEGDGYRLVLPDREVDIHRFARLVERGRRLLALDEPDPASHVLGEALHLWDEPALGDLDDWPEGHVELHRLSALHEDAEELLVEAMLRSGRARAALPEAVRLVEIAPVRESRWELLARAEYLCGRQAEALATIDRAREVLASEYGLDAGPGLASLQRRILRHDEALDVPAAPRPDARCPYPGLVPFEEEDAAHFVGRDDEVAASVARLRRDGVLVVVGCSGSGKSSLVRAGIVPRCRALGRSVRLVVASDRLRLPPPDDDHGPPDVLVVDQLEELTGPDVDATTRDGVLRDVVTQLEHGWLVLVIRADRLGELAASPVQGLVERHTFLLGPMDRRAIHRAIVEPAARAGLLVEPGLAALLVREVEDEPGGLPLLAHALRATWQRREGRTLTVAGYRAAGGIRGAIGRTADTLYEHFDRVERARVRDLFLRMVTRAGDDTLVASSVSRATAEAEVGHDVLEQLAAVRLVTLDGTRVRIAHEALVRAWPRLATWLDDDVAGQRIVRHLAVAAEDWDGLGRPESELYRGVRLAEAEAWWSSTRPRLTRVETTFLLASIARRDRRRDEERLRVTTAIARARRLRRLVTAIAMLAVLAIVAGSAAVVEATRASDAALVADARRVGAAALLEERVDTSLLLAVGAVTLEDSPDTRASLLTALGRVPALERVLVPGEARALASVHVTGDGETLVVGGAEGGLRAVDVASGATTDLLPASTGVDVGPAAVGGGVTALHPADGPVAHARADGGVAGGLGALDRVPVVLLDVASGRPVGHLALPPRPASRSLLPVALAWHPDGTAVAAVLRSHAPGDQHPSGALLAVWEPGDGTAVPRVTDDVPRFTRSLAWSPDGRTLVTGTDPTELGAEPVPSVTVWDARTLAVRTTFDGFGHPLAVSPDGRTIVAFAPDETGTGPVVLLDARTGARRAETDSRDGGARAVSFTPDGRLLVTATGRDVVTWDLSSRVGPGAGRHLTAVDELVGHAGAVTALAPLPGGGSLATVGADGAVMLWDLTGDRRPLSQRTRATGTVDVRSLPGLPVVAVPSPDGDHVLYVGATTNDGGGVTAAVQFLDVATGRTTPVAPVDAPTTWLAPMWERTGTAVTCDEHGRLIRWDPATGRPVATRATGTHGVLAGPAEDGFVVLTGDLSAVVLHDAEGRAAPPVTLASIEQTATLAFSPHTPRPLAVSTDGHVVAAFAGQRSTEGLDVDVAPLPDDGPALPSFLVDRRRPSDHLVVLDLRDLASTRVVELGFDGAAASIAPDGDHVAVAGRAGDVAVVDLRTGSLVGPPVRGHEGRSGSVTWTGDGRLVATGGEDGRVALWDARTGASVGSLAVAHVGSSPHVAPTGDAGVLIATASGEVLALDTRLDTWVTAACTIAGRAPTVEEWAVVAGDRPRPTTCEQG